MSQARHSLSSAARSITASQPSHLSFFRFSQVETDSSAADLSVKASVAVTVLVKAG